MISFYYLVFTKYLKMIADIKCCNIKVLIWWLKRYLHVLSSFPLSLINLNQYPGLTQFKGSLQRSLAQTCLRHFLTVPPDPLTLLLNVCSSNIRRRYRYPGSRSCRVLWVFKLKAPRYYPSKSNLKSNKIAKMSSYWWTRLVLYVYCKNQQAGYHATVMIYEMK